MVLKDVEISVKPVSDIFIIEAIDEKTKKIKVDEAEITQDKPAEFEKAITATGFGKFNLFLIFIGIPSCMATAIETSTISYVLPIAQCDLNLTLENKGLLNAITYIGMLPSAFIWGYLADTIGRKKPLVVAYLLNGFFVLLCGFSQHYSMLLFAKFMTGLMINGSFATVVSYINEFHAAKQRTLIPLLHGVINSLAGVILPLVGWLVFTDKINISLFGDFIILRSWNVFFMVCSIPSLLAGFTYLILPESPKYLMSMGRNDEAMKIFQRVYCINSGKSVETYPIKSLFDEIKSKSDSNLEYKKHLTANRSTMQALQEGWHQIVPLFHKPYLTKMFLVFSIQFGIMTSLNTLRLWLPQIFTAINDYQMFHKPDEDPDLCKMLEMVKPISINETINQTCYVNYDNSAVYVNNATVAAVLMIACFVFAFIIKKIGKRSVLVISELCAGVCSFALYFATNEELVVALSSIYLSASGIGAMIIVSIVVDVFPTTLRTMTLSLAMMLGRSGAMTGNLIFPFLLSSGCLPPFLTIGLIATTSGLLSLLLPKTDTKALE